MRYLQRGTGLVRANPWIWLLAAALSTFGLVVSLLLGAVPLVEGGFHVKFTVPTGIPDLSSILQGQGVALGGSANSIAFLIGLFGLLLNAFLSGGYLSGIFRLLHEESPSRDEFWSDCQRFFGRMVMAEILTLVFVILVGMMGLLLGPLVIVAVFFALAVTFFWRLAIVRDDLHLDEGISQGWQLFRANLSQVLGVALLVFLLTGLISVPVNLLAQSFLGYLADVFIWAFLGSAFSAGICSLYDRLADGDQPQF
jgi:hypothetical protein